MHMQTLKFVVDWIPLEKQWPDMHQEVWVVCKDGKVFRDNRTNDTYHNTDERLKWSRAGHLGFQDLAEYHKYNWGIVTHWAPYIEPLPPDKPLCGFLAARRKESHD